MPNTYINVIQSVISIVNIQMVFIFIRDMQESIHYIETYMCVGIMYIYRVYLWRLSVVRIFIYFILYVNKITNIEFFL